jgi:hypothetical protein
VERQAFRGDTLRGDGTGVHETHLAIDGEHPEIPTDGHFGHTETLGKLAYGCAASELEDFQYL